MHFLFESERLGFRQFHPDDAEGLYRLNLDPEVLRYTGDAPFGSVAEAREFILGYDQYHKYGHGRWSVVQRHGGNLLGWCGLKNRDGVIDLGYRFFRSAWGRGYATEAARACIEYGFNQLGMNRITARALPENIGSWKVLEKAGMEFTGINEEQDLKGARMYEIRKPGF